jgi:hypothetical protein
MLNNMVVCGGVIVYWGACPDTTTKATCHHVSYIGPTNSNQGLSNPPCNASLTPNSFHKHSQLQPPSAAFSRLQISCHTSRWMTSYAVSTRSQTIFHLLPDGRVTLNPCLILNRIPKLQSDPSPRHQSSPAGPGWIIWSTSVI